MDTPHPNDKLAALDWAISQARSVVQQDFCFRKTVLTVLQQMRDEAQREAGRTPQPMDKKVSVPQPRYQ